MRRYEIPELKVVKFDTDVILDLSNQGAGGGSAGEDFGDSLIMSIGNELDNYKI